MLAALREFRHQVGRVPEQPHGQRPAVAGSGADPVESLVNVAAGATWVSVHHGGGVGIGNSIHAGMVVVADGTADAADRLERVLTTDPGMGVIRHVDAGYDEALDAAEHGGLKIPSAPRDA